MEHLWAPWRKAYVSGPPQSLGHIFEEIARSTDDEKNLVLLRGKSCFALLNAYPYNTGHSMVVPYRVTGELDDLATEELSENMEMLRCLKKALTAAFQPQGFNIGINLGAAAGAGIAQHLHWHIVPRWRSDANFMTTTGSTRIHPSDLTSVHASIKQALAS